MGCHSESDEYDCQNSHIIISCILVFIALFFLAVIVKSNVSPTQTISLIIIAMLFAVIEIIYFITALRTTSRSHRMVYFLFLLTLTVLLFTF